MLLSAILILLFTLDCGQQTGPAEKVTLRSVSADLTQDQIDRIIAERGFHGPGDKIKGSFRNRYEQAQIRGIDVIIDHTTDLMWLKAENEERLDWREAEAFASRMNDATLAGFSDWRIPTVEELMSLMASGKKDDKYIDPVFKKALLSTWTIDTKEDTPAGAWFVDFMEGKVLDGNRAAGLGHVHLVRSME